MEFNSIIIGSLAQKGDMTREKQTQSTESTQLESSKFSWEIQVNPLLQLTPSKQHGPRDIMMMQKLED